MAAPKNYHLEVLPLIGDAVRAYTMGTTESGLQIDDTVHTAMLKLYEVRAALESVGLWLQASSALPEGRLSVGGLRQLLSDVCLVMVLDKNNIRCSGCAHCKDGQRSHALYMRWLEGDTAILQDHWVRVGCQGCLRFCLAFRTVRSI